MHCILQGIPIIYYGTEQGFNGYNDPHNRESLWPHYDTNSDLYKFISTLATYRQKLGSSVYQSQQVERYVDNQFFAFTRDKVWRVHVPFFFKLPICVVLLLVVCGNYQCW